MSSALINDALTPIRCRFVTMLSEAQVDIQDDLQLVLDEPAGSHDAFRRIAARLHKIAGTAGMLGFAQMGEQARSAENQIITLLKHDAAPPQEACMQVIDFLEVSLAVTDEDA